jgi:acyl-CoA oxidase
MLQSKQLKDNASLYVFLPIFYTVWSDAVLTPSEIATLEGLVNNQHGLPQRSGSFYYLSLILLPHLHPMN